jgi:hypothetical protein
LSCAIISLFAVYYWLFGFIAAGSRSHELSWPVGAASSREGKTYSGIENWNLSQK